MQKRMRAGSTFGSSRARKKKGERARSAKTAVFGFPLPPFFSEQVVGMRAQAAFERPLQASLQMTRHGFLFFHNTKAQG